MNTLTGGRLALTIVLGIPSLIVLLFVAAIVLTPLPSPDNPETTEILDATGHTITSLYTENRVEVPLLEMPSYLLDAIVAIEDDRFYRHNGIDLIGIGRAIVRNLRAGKILEGGSTLTQQLARNLYLTQERTMVRKLKEAVLTVKLEYTYTKKEILGMYWNTIYLGRGTYGVEVAALTYFGKSTKHLTLSEAALLAGLPRAPEYYAPTNDLEAAVGRRNLVLARMAEQGFITHTQAGQASAEKPSLTVTSTKPTEAPYFVDYAIRELHQRFPEVAANLYQGGYRIHTTLDLKIQRSADQVIASQGGSTAEGIPQVALVALEPNTGYIRALLGGRDRQVVKNRVLEPRQPGSAFKPFVYAAVLETYSYTASSTQMDAPAAFPGAIEGQLWRPRNFADKYTHAPATMRQALRKSINVVTAQWANTVKPQPIISLARRMGIESSLANNLTISLGSSEVTPLELTRAYAPLANGGFNVRPIAVLRVQDRKGNLLVEQDTVRSRALDPGVAFIITSMLKDVFKPGGTADRIGDVLAGLPAAGKTGTSDESRDAWFVGYTPDLVTGVWVGSDDRAASSTRTGGSAAAPIWADFVSRALRGKPHRDWSPPANVVYQEICSLTGLRPNASCPLAHEWYLKGTAPVEVDPTVHWDQLLPELPGMPWVPPGTLPPGVGPTSPPSTPPEVTWPPFVPGPPSVPRVLPRL